MGLYSKVELKWKFPITDFEWAINLNRWMLRIVTLWPPDNYGDKFVSSKVRLLLNPVTILCIITIPIFIALTKVWGDMNLMIDNLQFSAPFLIAIFKACVFRYKQEDLLPLIDMIAQDWKKQKMKKEQDVMLWHAKISRIITVCALLMIILAVFTVCSTPCLELIIAYKRNLSNFEISLPIPSYYLHNTCKSPQFELTLLAQASAMFIAGLSYSGVDNFLGLSILHVCGQLENLYSRISHMENYSNFHALMKYNIQDHIRLIRSIEIIDNTFHLMLLVAVLLFGIIFCLQGFLIVNALKNKESQLSIFQIFWFASAMLSGLLHMCIYCAAGEMLVTKCEKIYRSAYEYSWYTLEPKAARNLILIMLRANKPLYITAGKMVPMTMVTFSSLLKTSAGYVSVLLANQN